MTLRPSERDQQLHLFRGSAKINRMGNYYNEYEPFMAAWLRELIKRGLIPDGDVDERSIVDVKADDVKGYVQCHWFAGLGGWSHALQLAGWPSDRSIWTASLPCQPFSAAGKQKGFDDERHLWPVFRGIVDECRPPTIIGEQISARLGREWLAGVRADLEALGYGVGAADLCSASAGAPHIRQRLHWVADAQHWTRRIDGELGTTQSGGVREISGEGVGIGIVGDHCTTGRLADCEGDRRREECEVSGGFDERDRAQGWSAGSLSGGAAGRLADVDGGFAGHRGVQSGGEYGQQPEDGRAGGLGDTHDPRSQGRNDRSGESGRGDQRSTGSTGQSGFWSTYDVVHCTDGKTRRTQSQIQRMASGLPEGVVRGGFVGDDGFPLTQGAAKRVGRLRGYGNAINPEIASIFIKAFANK